MGANREGGGQKTSIASTLAIAEFISFAEAPGAILKNAVIGLLWHDGVMVASAIAFSLVFALFPFLIFIVALAAAIGGAGLGDYISREALAAFPDHMVKTLEPELKRIFATENKASLLSFGLVITLVSITGAVEAVRDGLNRAYRCSEDRSLLRRYGSSLLFVFLAMAFIIIVATLGFVAPIWIRYIEFYVPEFHIDVGVLEIAREVLLVSVMAVMLLVTHLLLPARKRRWRSVAVGAITTLVFWWFAGRLFGTYLTSIANYSATYAGLGGIVALMFFLYVQSLIFIFGGELNRAIAEWRAKRKERRAPSEPVLVAD